MMKHGKWWLLPIALTVLFAMGSVPVAAYPQENPPGGGCTSDADCDDGLFCSGRERCDIGTHTCWSVDACPASVPETVCNEEADRCQLQECSVDDGCGPGRFCQGGLCAQDPNSDPVETIADGILGYYPLEYDGDDASGNGYHAHATAEVTYGPGRVGRAAFFGVPQAAAHFPVEMRELANLSFTISAWVYLESYDLIGDSDEVAGIAGRLGLHPGDSERPPGTVVGTASHPDATGRSDLVVSSREPVPLGRWTHLALSYKWRLTAPILVEWLELYVDGELNATENNFRYDAAENLVESPAESAIGWAYDFETSRSASLDGWVDEVFVHRRALSPSEIRLLASRGGNPRTTRSGEGGWGENPEEVCQQHFHWPPLMWSRCRVSTTECEPGLIKATGLSKCLCPVDADGGTAVGCNIDPPLIEVEPLPDRIDLEGFPLREGIKGFQAIIRAATHAEFVVPDGRSVPVDCHNLKRYKDHICKYDSNACREITSFDENCHTATFVCPVLGIKDRFGRGLPFAMHSLEAWRTFTDARLLVNANFFDIYSDVRFEDFFPHIYPCTDIYGYSVSKGRTISAADVHDHQGEPNDDGSFPVDNPVDALLITDQILPDSKVVRRIQIVRNDQIQSSCQEPCQVSYAVGGFIIAEDGRTRRSGDLSSSVKPLSVGSRTAVGLSEDGKTMYIVVVQQGERGPIGLAVRELAAYLLTLGASDVMSLDNSGSSQFIYGEGRHVSKTLPGGHDPEAKPAHRPIPNFLGIR